MSLLLPLMRLSGWSYRLQLVLAGVPTVCTSILLGALIVMTASCASPGFVQIDQQAAESGFVRTTVKGGKFRHVLYASNHSTVSPVSAPTPSDTIHIYIDGDGVNWQWNRFVKTDPTPSRSLMLQLMAMDNNKSLYVGRPCYLGLELDDGCDADYWTYERYSEKVVSSMVEVISSEAAGYRNVVLIGHSGGGALALLIAEHLPAVTAVVTIAAIIDTDAWTTHHGYTPLVGSLNPSTRSPLSMKVKQLHLVGGRDENIPPALVRQWVAGQSGARLWEVPDNTHMCCWNKNWPAVLLWIASAGDELNLDL